MSSKKVSVTLTYASTGAQPPIFLAGSFSEPAWHPQEMDFTTDENGEHHFHKEVDVDEGGEFQYKFRIGLGDWWALNEQAPTVTDEHGNRNNLLAVPSAEEIVEKSKTPEPATAPPVSDMPIPEVFVEKVDEEPHHGDEFSPDATTGQEDAHDMRALDAEPDHVVIRSQTNTPVYANTAAEVADSAALLDREPSPAPVADEEAGRTGERRMSGTPIPQVALIAAEVADVAAILDQDDDMILSPPNLHYPYDTPSGASTPWRDQAPLFAHECLGPNDGVEVESPITSESLESPKVEPEEVIDLNDPLLERFPEDRLSILTHIRSCESRMSEDETNVHGVPPSPITKPNSRSPSIDTPNSARLDAQPSPVLDVIAEEHHEENGHFDGLQGPSQKTQGAQEIRLPEELNVIHEAEEPSEDPKTVLDNLKKIEESTTDSNKVTVNEETVKPEVDERIPVEESGMAEERNMTDGTREQLKELTETKEALNHNAEDSQTRPTGTEVQTDPEDYVAREDRHSDMEEESAPGQTSDTSVHKPDPSEQVRNQAEHIHDDRINNVGQYQSEDGPVPEVLMEPKKDFNEHEEVYEESKDVVREEDLHQNRELLHAEHDEDHQNVGVLTQRILAKHSESVPIMDPQLVELKGEILKDEGLDDGLKDIMQPQGHDGPQQHDSHLHSVEAEQHLVEDSQEMAEPMKISEPKEPDETQLDIVNGISMGGVVMSDLLADGTLEVRDVAHASTGRELTTEHDVLGTEAHQSAIALENPQTDVEPPQEADSPVSKMHVDNEIPMMQEQDALEADAHQSAIAPETPQTDAQRSIGADLLILETKADEVSLTPEQDVLGSKSQKSEIPVDNALTEAETTHEADLPISQMKVDEQVSQMPEQQVLDSEIDMSENPLAMVETSHEADLPISQLNVDDETPPIHVKSAKSDSNDVGEIDDTLTNGVDTGKSTSVDDLPPNGYGSTSKLSPCKTATPNFERPLTPSSIRSPLKAPETENFFKTIWRTVFVEWLGGLFASLCAGDRGPLLAISALVIIGPLLAMYFLQLDVL